MTRLSYNIHGNHVPDKARLLAHLQATRPRWVLVMDNLDTAREIKAALPDTNVIFRAWPDDSIHTQVTPEEWVNQKAAAIGNTDVWCYTTNEPGFSDEALTWNAAVIEHAAARGMKVCVGNFSSGTPAPDDWHRPAAKRLLQMCASHRDTTVLGCHEYACGVITSGMIGGTPKFIQPSDWPRNVEDVVCWHVGRVRLLLEACDWLAIEPPRIVMTEAGFDDMSDIKAWSDTLLKTPPYENIRGWKSLWNQWRVWWPTWTPQKAYAEQMKYADTVLYADTPVEGILMFCWGASSEMWAQFDVSQADEFHAALEAYAAPVTAPARRYEPDVYVMTGDTAFNVRPTASTSGVPRGKLSPGDTVKVLDANAVTADLLLWQQVDITPKAATNLTLSGWVAVTDLELTLKVTEPPAPPPLPIHDFTRVELLTLAESYERMAVVFRAAAERLAA